MTIFYRQYVPETHFASDGLDRAEDAVRQHLSASADENDDPSRYYNEVKLHHANGYAPGCSDTKDGTFTGVWVCGSLDREPVSNIDATPQGSGKAAKLTDPKELSAEEFKHHMATKSEVQNAT